MKYFVRRFREKPDNKFLITKGDAVYALVLGAAIILCLGATLLFILNKIQAKQIDNLLSPKLAEMYSFIVNATNEEYEDVAQEIQHSLIRTSYNMDDLDLLDKMPNTSTNCPLYSEHLEGQVYLVAFNTGELYRLDVFDETQYENQKGDGSYGYAMIGGGFDEISRTSMSFRAMPDDGVNKVTLSRYYGILSYHRVKANFCETCIHQLVSDLENAGAGELALFDPSTHEINPISEGLQYTIGDYNVTITRDMSDEIHFNSYILLVRYNG